MGLLRARVLDGKSARAALRAGVERPSVKKFCCKQMPVKGAAFMVRKYMTGLLDYWLGRGALRETGALYMGLLRARVLGRKSV